jgi:hypothetical protein
MPTASPSRANPAPLVNYAKHFIYPAAAVASPLAEQLGAEIVRLGFEFDGWQADLWTLGLAETATGSLACRIEGVTASIPRQVGKSRGIGIGLIGLCIAIPGLKCLWTAHHERTIMDLLGDMDFLTSQPMVAPHIRQFRRTNGQLAIYFTNGSAIHFSPREGGFGVGIAAVDIVVFDEAQNLSQSAVANIKPTMLTSRFGLTFFIGTPPRPALGWRAEVFTRKRRQALDAIREGRRLRGVYVEFGAPDDYEMPVYDIDQLEVDAEFWAIIESLNPAFPRRVDKDSILTQVSDLSPDDFAREILGKWDRETQDSVVSANLWTTLRSEPDLGPVSAFGVNSTRSGWFCITACWVEGESAHVEIAMSTQSELEAFNFLTRHATKKTPIKHDSTGAAKALGEKLKQRGYKASAHTLADSTAANALWLGMVEERRLTHGGQPDLDTAVRGARREDRKAGGWLLMPRSDSFDIGPAIAMTEAVYAAMTTKSKGGRVL